MYRLLPLAVLLLAGCAVVEQIEPRQPSETQAAPGETPPPPRNARTVEDFDTTSAEARRDAATPASGGRLLGTTVASLGDAGTPGFWAETPLVDAPGKGRLRYPASGRSVEVELRPAEGGSSRVSLAALRLLEASLTDLVTLEVYAQ